MRRRSVLAWFGGAGATVLAGCLGIDDDDSPDAPPVEDPEDGGQTPGEDSGQTPSEDSDPGTPGSDEDGETPESDGEGETPESDEEGEAAPGEEGETPESDPGEERYVDEADEQVGLSYGEAAELSNGVQVTVHGISIEQQLSGQVPNERDEFALVEVESVNDGDAEARLPEETDPTVELLYEDQQIGPTFDAGVFRESDYDRYEGGDVQSGVRREGHVLYEVDAGLSEADIDFLWQDDIFVAGDLPGVVDVRWSAE